MMIIQLIFLQSAVIFQHNILCNMCRKPYNEHLSHNTITFMVQLNWIGLYYTDDVVLHNGIASLTR